MPLATGTRLGHYEIVSLLGSGGMGTVYKAVDSRLDRTVAIKVLQRVSPELRQRFEREARVVAALQHPRICTLMDIGTDQGTEYLVMEYLDGGTLTCPQPFDKVIEYGIQIADALDAASRKGITHRDLKPGNIIVTRSGIKLLDFGIAKAANSETLTETGVAIGTPAYMAPEQWRGGATDHRTDIYALGCVLHEMATGHKSIDTPVPQARLEFVVRGCLAPDPDDRWQSARDVKRLLESIGAERGEPTPPPGRAWMWTAAVALAGLAGIAAAWMLKPGAPQPLYQLSIVPPSNGDFLFSRNREGGLAVSPDGSTIVFVAQTAEKIQLWMRRLDSSEAQPVPGTEGAFYPFWSPDSRWIAFFTPDRLMKVAATGGAPQTICTTEPRAIGGSWGAGDVIVVASDSGASLNRVAAGGGTLAPVTTGTQPLAGRWPYVLPDGQRFLFDNREGIWAASIASGEAPRRLVASGALRPAYSNRHLLFIRDRNLYAQRFDPESLQLSGEALRVAEVLAGNIGDNPGEYAVTSGGLLAYASGQRLSALVWHERGGKPLGELAGGAEISTPRISPDGRQVAFARVDGTNTDIWIADVHRGTAARLTFDPAIDRWPIWSPDGKTVTYSSGEGLNLDLYRRAADGSGSADRVTRQSASQHAMDWSPDGKYLAFTRNEIGSGTNLMILPAGGAEYVYLRTKVSEAHSQFDPATVRWIAYSSDDSGRREIYVKPFSGGQPASDARWQISTAGGTMPRWRRDGKELYYWALDGRMMAATIDGSGAAFKWSPPSALFQAGPPPLRTNDLNFDVMPDGKRFLLLEPAGRVGSQPLTVITDWVAATSK